MTGELITKGITPQDDKTAMWNVDRRDKNYNPANPWSTAHPITYEVGRNSALGYVTGRKLRSDHPLAGKGWHPGDQVYEEDLLDMTHDFIGLIRKFESAFLDKGRNYEEKLKNCDVEAIGNIENARLGELIYYFAPNRPFDLKSEKRDNYDEVPSYEASVIGEYSFFNGRVLKWEDYGNAFFGLMGGPGMKESLPLLLLGADIDQRVSSGSKDPGHDQYFIEYGFNRLRNGK